MGVVDASAAAVVAGASTNIGECGAPPPAADASSSISGVASVVWLPGGGGQHNTVIVGVAAKLLAVDVAFGSPGGGITMAVAVAVALVVVANRAVLLATASGVIARGAVGVGVGTGVGVGVGDGVVVTVVDAIIIVGVGDGVAPNATDVGGSAELLRLMCTKFKRKSAAAEPSAVVAQSLAALVVSATDDQLVSASLRGAI